MQITSEERIQLAALLDALAHYLPPPELVPLRHDGVQLGLLEPDFAEAVCTRQVPWLQREPDGIDLAPDIRASDLTVAWRELCLSLRPEGWFRAWRDELYDVRSGAGTTLCRLERGVFRRFGLTSEAVHVNAISPDGRMWVARRAASKAIDPLRLDNLVGGGIGAGESAMTTLIREAYEEAGVPGVLAIEAEPVTRLHSLRMESDGLHNEWLAIYTLNVPKGFLPRNLDGEVESFKLMEPWEVCARVFKGEFTVDAAAVAILWLLSH